jgi:hypothetical protein
MPAPESYSGIPGKPHEFVPLEEIPDAALNPEEVMIVREETSLEDDADHTPHEEVHSSEEHDEFQKTLDAHDHELEMQSVEVGDSPLPSHGGIETERMSPNDSKFNSIPGDRNTTHRPLSSGRTIDGTTWKNSRPDQYRPNGN